MLSVDLYCIIACCCNKFAGASIFIIAHPGSSLQSLIPCSFLPYHPPPPKPKTGFHLPRALATAQRLAVLETLVPNPPNPQFPPPSALNGKDQAHSTLLWVHPASALRQGNLNNSTSTAEAGHWSPPLRLTSSPLPRSTLAQTGLHPRSRILFLDLIPLRRPTQLPPPAKKCASCSSRDSLEPLGFWSTPPRPPLTTTSRCKQTLRPCQPRSSRPTR